MVNSGCQPWLSLLLPGSHPPALTVRSVKRMSCVKLICPLSAQAHQYVYLDAQFYIMLIATFVVI